MENSDLIDLNIDYLVISNIDQNMEGLLSITNSIENIICDSSNSFKVLNSGGKYKYESIYYVPAQGAYIKQINNEKW